MTQTAGQLISALKAVDDHLDRYNGIIRTLKMERDALAEAIEQLMDAQGTTMLASDGLVCEAKEDEVPQLTDWNKFEQYVLRHKKLELLQRRISPAAWRALVEELGMAVPGIGVFKKRKLSVRKKA